MCRRVQGDCVDIVVIRSSGISHVLSEDVRFRDHISIRPPVESRCRCVGVTHLLGIHGRIELRQDHLSRLSDTTYQQDTTTDNQLSHLSSPVAK